MVFMRGFDFPGLEFKRGKKTNQVYYHKRNIGFIKKLPRGKAEYYKPAVDRNKHVYRKWNSVGIEKLILNALELLNVERVCFQFKGEEGWYKVPLEVWQALGRDLTYCGIVQKQLSMHEINKFALTQMFDDVKKLETPKELKEYPSAKDIINDVINEQNKKLGEFL